MKPLVWKSNRLVPSTSPGIRSGVNWIRPNCRRRPAAKARVIRVLAVPGTPSSRMWPPTSRLVSISSMTASCPTTALRTSARTPSAFARMSCTSIEDAPLPAMCITCEPNERRGVAPARSADLGGSLHQRAAVDLDAARAGDPLQPGDQPLPGQAAGRMQLARDVLYVLLDVARHHHRLMPGKLDQLRHVLQQAAAPGAERRRRG